MQSLNLVNSDRDNELNSYVLLENNSYINKIPIEVIENIIPFLNLKDLISYTKSCDFINRIITASNRIENLVFNKLQLPVKKIQLIATIYNKENYAKHIRMWLLKLGLYDLVNNLDCHKKVNFHKVLYLQLIKQLAYLSAYNKDQTTQLAKLTDCLDTDIITQSNNSIKYYNIKKNKELQLVSNDNCTIKIGNIDSKYAVSKDQKYRAYLAENNIITIINPVSDYDFSNIIYSHLCTIYIYDDYRNICFGKLCLDNPIANMCFNQDCNLLAVTVNIANKKKLENKVFTGASLLFYYRTAENNWSFLCPMLAKSDFVFCENNFTDRNIIIPLGNNKVIEYDVYNKYCIHKFTNVNFASYGGNKNLALTMIINNNNKSTATTFVNKICINQYDNINKKWQQQQVLLFDCSKAIKNMLFSDCGSLFAVHSSNYLAIYKKHEIWQKIKELVINNNEIHHLEFSIDGNYMVAYLNFNKKLISLTDT